MEIGDRDAQEMIALLREIRDNQQRMLERQAEHTGLVREQAERASRIQDRAEQIQARSAQLVSGSRKVLAVLLPVIVALIAYVTWLIFRYTLR